MRTLLTTVAAATLLLATATTARADIAFSPTNSPQGNEENILFQQKFNDVTTLTGHTNQTNAPIIFDNIAGAPKGQADIGTNGVGQADIVCTLGCNSFATGGANGMQLTDIEIKAGSGFGFTDFIGNLDFGEGTAQISVTDQMGAVFDYVLGNGQNFFTLTASNNEVITDIQIESADSTQNFGFNDLKQPRVSGICTLQGTTCTAVPVPEPASLAIFGSALVGLGAVARRRRRRDRTPPQAA